MLTVIIHREKTNYPNGPNKPNNPNDPKNPHHPTNIKDIQNSERLTPRKMRHNSLDYYPPLLKNKLIFRLTHRLTVALETVGTDTRDLIKINVSKLDELNH